MPMGEDFDAYKLRWQERFYDLLAAARQKNQLYFLLNLLNSWGGAVPLGQSPHASSIDFNVEINRATTSLILDRIRAGRSEPVPPLDMLFVLQLNMESKAFYAALRNFAAICREDIARQEPWKLDEFPRQGVLLTGQIITNLAGEIEKAGFGDLACEFRNTHIDDTRMIRNAVAHGNFRLPSDETDHQWVFGVYVGKAPGHVYMNTERMGEEQVREIFLRFLSFRLAFFSAAGDHEEEVNTKSFKFRAPNQMKPEEVLDCEFDRGVLTIKYQGTPLW